MRILSIFSLFIFVCLASVAGRPIDVLLYGHNPGDSKALKQIIKELKKNNLSYAVVASGPGIKILEKEKNLRTLRHGSSKKHTDALYKGEIRSLKKDLEPKIVMAGMSSVVQAEVLNAFPEAKRVVIYDHFDMPRTKKVIQPFLKTVNFVDVCFVPATFLVPSFQALFKGSKIEVVSHPALTEWEQIFQTIDRARLREDLDVKPTEKVIVFVGGVESTYEDHLNLFMQTVKRHPKWRVFVVPHLTSDGWEEKKARGGIGNVSEEMKRKLIELASIADVMVCHKSSACPLAFLMGMPCLYLAEKEYKNFFIERGLIPHVATEEALEQLLIQCLAKKAEPWVTRCNRNRELLQAQVPLAPPAQLIVDDLINLLNDFRIVMAE